MKCQKDDCGLDVPENHADFETTQEVGEIFDQLAHKLQGISDKAYLLGLRGAPTLGLVAEKTREEIILPLKEILAIATNLEYRMLRPLKAI